MSDGHSRTQRERHASRNLDPTLEGSIPDDPRTPEPAADDSYSDLDDSVVAQLRKVADAPPIDPRRTKLGPGTKLSDHLELTEQLGAGGMGVVYLARDHRLDRDVAIKLHRGDTSTAARARLHREAQAMAKLSHPNVVPVHEVGIHHGMLYIVMEYVRGETAQSWPKGKTSREVARLYLQAAKGLAAAHAAGLIHRDFKPQNVLVGDDGRVRVADFGLARWRTDPEVAVNDATAIPFPSVSQSGNSPEVSVTQGVVGTPAFMAPEQYGGGRASALGDQFSWGLSFLEGLLGEPPFPRRMSLTLTQDELRERVRDAALSGWLTRLLERTLQLEPARRYESMQAVVVALERGLKPQHRMYYWWSLALVAAAGVTATVMGGGGSQVCADAQAELAQTWSEQRRGELHQVFSGLRGAAGAKVWADLESRLDGYATQWVDARRKACEATRIHESRTERQLERSAWCLSLQREKLGAVLRALSSTDEESLLAGWNLVSDLPRPSACLDEGFLRNDAASAPDPRVAPAVVELMENLYDFEANQAVGNVPPVSELEDLMVRARELGHAPAEVSALHLRANHHRARSRRQEALADYHAAYFRARAAELDEQAANVALHLAFMFAGEQATTDQAETWVKQAEVELERNPSLHGIAGDVASIRGVLLEYAGDYGSAAQRQRQALEMCEDHGCSERSEAEIYNRLGTALQADGRLSEAKAALDQGIAMLQSDGKTNPWLAVLQGNRGLVHAALREHEAAVEDLRTVAEYTAEMAGADGAAAQGTYLNLAVAYHSAERYEDAEAVLQDALPRARRILGDDHPDVALHLDALGLTEFHLGRFDVAARHLAEAVSLAERKVGADHPTTAIHRTHYADALRKLERYDEAQAELSAALAVWNRIDSAHHRRAETLLGLALLHHDRGETDEAAQVFESVLDLAKTHEVDPVVTTTAREHLAVLRGDAPGR